MVVFNALSVTNRISSTIGVVKSFTLTVTDKRTTSDGEILSREEIQHELENSVWLYYCNLCGNEIEDQSKRNHCSECNNFDVCDTCYKIRDTLPTKHPNHYFYPEVQPHSQYHAQLIGPSFAQTLWNCFFVCWKNRPCIGSRVLITENPVKYGEFAYLTFEEVGTLSMNFGTALKSYADPKSFVVICMQMRLERYIADYGCLMNGFKTAPVAPTMDDTALRHVIHSTNASIVVCTEDQTQRFVDMKCPGLKYIVQVGQNNIECKEVTILNYEQVLKKGETLPQSIVPTDPDELLTLQYTSGSTGLPKGGIVTDSLWNRVADTHYRHQDPMVSLAWSVSKRKDSLIVHCNGGRVALYSGDMNLIFEDIQAARPSAFSSTPRLWIVMYEQYKKALAAAVLDSPNETFEQIDTRVLKQFSQIFGDRLTHIGTGGAPTPPIIIDFLKRCFTVRVSESYAATEVGGIFSNNEIHEWASVKLVDWEEYTSKDDPPRGEICVKTETMIQGYYGDDINSPFDSEGFYHTGDIGYIQGNKIWIIDRKKNIFKLSQGEYVAPEKLETLYSVCPFVEQICIYGDSLKPYLIAIVVPKFPDTWTGSRDLGDEQLKLTILTELSTIGRSAKVRTWEIPVALIFESKPWTAENGGLTVSGKISRHQLKKRYDKQIHQVYFQVEKSGPYKDKFFVETESKVNELMTSIMGENVSNIIELGYDSLSAVRLQNMILQQFQVKVPMEILYNPNIVDIAKYVNDRDVVDQIDWQKEMKLADSILDSIPENSKEISNTHILLTGVTGFLGAFLLEQLLLQTKSIIYCLIRAESQSQSQSRFIQHLKFLKLLHPLEEYLNRVVLCVGDLSLYHFGWEESFYNEMSQKIETIYHCGAMVNTLAPYTAMRPANVVGTLEVIRFATTLQKKTIHYVSSVSVFRSNEEIANEDDVLKRDYLHSSRGYHSSKLVAEMLLERAKEKGVKVSIYRPGFISGHSSTGASNMLDFDNRLFSNIIASKIAPFSEVPSEVSPVDWVSKSIVQISLQKDSIGGKYHLANALEISVNDIVNVMNEMGYNVEQVEFRKWQEIIKEISVKDPLYPLLNSFSAEKFPARLSKYSCQNTFKWIQDKPQLNKEYLSKIVQFLKINES